MKITVVNGQSHKGSTYHIGKMLADKLGGKVTEFFLPKDFSDMCKFSHIIGKTVKSR